MRHTNVVEIQELRSTNRVRTDFFTFVTGIRASQTSEHFFVMLFVGTPRPSTGVFPVSWDIGGMDLLLPLLHTEAHIVSG